MDTKVHFLAIPAQEFSKILTDPRHQYLSDLLKLHHWHHRQYYKFIVPDQNPVEIRDLLDRMDIRYFYTVIPFQFHCNILTPII